MSSETSLANPLRDRAPTDLQVLGELGDGPARLNRDRLAALLGMERDDFAPIGQSNLVHAAID